jgi:hypothetical protein
MNDWNRDGGHNMGRMSLWKSAQDVHTAAGRADGNNVSPFLRLEWSSMTSKEGGAQVAAERERRGVECSCMNTSVRWEASREEERFCLFKTVDGPGKKLIWRQSLWLRSAVSQGSRCRTVKGSIGEAVPQPWVSVYHGQGSYTADKASGQSVR